MLVGTSIRRGYVDVDGGQLHYRYCGKPQACPILLLHQSPSSSIMFEKLMTAIGGDYYILAPDTPGFGATDALSSLSIDACAQVVKQFLDSLGVDQCFVFGHHTGASIAVQLAFDNPDLVSALSLSGPTLLSDELKSMLPAKAEAFPLEEDGQHLLDMWRRIRNKDSEAPLVLSLREALLAFQCGDEYKTAYQAVVEQDFGSQLKALECPVQVFSGDNDPLYSCVDTTLELLKKGEKSVMPTGSGTYICDLNTSELSKTVLDFYHRNHPNKN